MTAKYRLNVFSCGLSLATAGAASVAALSALCPVQAAEKKPNIIVIMGDDVGWFNIGAYHRGIMPGKTPNLDKLASEACYLPIITPRRAARRVGPISSLARYRFALVLPR